MNENQNNRSAASRIFYAVKRAVIINLLFNKRMLKNRAFLAILVAIPILLGAFSLSMRGAGGGAVTIALAMDDPSDSLASEICTELLADKGLVGFLLCDSRADAIDAVAEGRADGAWIFPEELEEKISDFSSHPTARNSFMLIVQREDNIFLRLSHEKLHGVLYPYMSVALYEKYLYKHIISLDELSREEAIEFYNAVNSDGEDLFSFVYLDDETSEVDVSTASFLTSPMRGILAIMVILCAIAVSMFYSHDEERGLFDRFHRKKRFTLSLSYHFAAIFDVCAVVFVSLAISGMLSAIGWEILSMLLFCVATVGFCIALRLICPNMRVLGALSPLLLAVMAVLCPIFIPAVKIPVLQYLLPPFYYLNGVYNHIYLLYLAVYCVAIFLFDYLLYRVRER